YRNITMFVDGIRHHFHVHRMIWMWMTGEDPGKMEIDHKDRNGLNNKWDNLRLSTHSQNHFNKASPKRDLPRGVHRNGKKFIAYMKRNGKSVHLGTFHTAQEASDFFQAESKKVAGEFLYHP